RQRGPALSLARWGYTEAGRTRVARDLDPTMGAANSVRPPLGAAGRSCRRSYVPQALLSGVAAEWNTAVAILLALTRQRARKAITLLFRTASFNDSHFLVLRGNCAAFRRPFCGHALWFFRLIALARHDG